MQASQLLSAKRQVASGEEKSSGRGGDQVKSKQRHVTVRPGDWGCPECGFHNYSRNSECYRCHACRPALILNPSSDVCPKRLHEKLQKLRSDRNRMDVEVREVEDLLELICPGSKLLSSRRGSTMSLGGASEVISDVSSRKAEDEPDLVVEEELDEVANMMSKSLVLSLSGFEEAKRQGDDATAPEFFKARAQAITIVKQVGDHVENKLTSVPNQTGQDSTKRRVADLEKVVSDLGSAFVDYCDQPGSGQEVGPWAHGEVVLPDFAVGRPESDSNYPPVVVSLTRGRLTFVWDNGVTMTSTLCSLYPDRVSDPFKVMRDGVLVRKKTKEVPDGEKAAATPSTPPPPWKIVVKHLFLLLLNSPRRCRRLQWPQRRSRPRCLFRRVVNREVTVPLLPRSEASRTAVARIRLCR